MTRFLRPLVFLLFQVVGAVAYCQQNSYGTTGNFFEGSITYANEVSGPKAEQLKDAEPCRKMDLHLRGGDFIIQLYEGANPKTLLFINDSNQVYVVDLENGRAFRKELYKRRHTTVPQARPLHDSVKVLGNLCYGYVYRRPPLARDTVRFPAATIKLYVSPQFRVDISKYAGKERNNAFFLLRGLQGCIPLKVIVQTPGLTETNTAIHLKEQHFTADMFRLPAGTVIYPGVDYRR